jgi:hypothetical protein
MPIFRTVKSGLLNVRLKRPVLALFALTLAIAAYLLFAFPMGQSQAAPNLPRPQAAWVNTGNLNIGRYAHSATLLQDGRVLVTGGRSSTIAAPLNSAEIYNPQTGAWTFTGNMGIVRDYHTATLLQDGRVLVAGGSSDKRTEIYNPATSTWTFTSELSQPRTSHTAHLLANGKVLVTAGIAIYPQLAVNGELYDPATGLWTPTGNLNNGRYDHASVGLPDGRVVIIGGQTGNPPSGTILNSVEIYNPQTNTWTLSNPMTFPRLRHGWAFLAGGTGRIMVMGGASFGSYRKDVEIFDVATQTWSAGSPLPTQFGFIWASVVVQPDGKILVAGGSEGGAFLYNPSLNSWTTVPTLSYNIYFAPALLLPSGKTLVIGGIDTSSSMSRGTKQVALYDPNAPTVTSTEIEILDNAVYYGELVTIAVRVYPTKQVPGAVQIRNGAIVLATLNLDTQSVATFTTATLPVGNYNITAHYLGTTSFLPSSSNSSQLRVERGKTVITLDRTSSSTVFYEPLIFSATVKPEIAGLPTPTGSVVFSINYTQVYTTVLDSSGRAFFPANNPALFKLGNNDVAAYYNPDATPNEPSSGVDPYYNVSFSLLFNQVISKAPVTVYLESLNNPAVAGQPVTLTALVKPAAPLDPSATVPTGTITFKEGNTTLGTVSLNASGAAIFSPTTPFTTGNYTLSAEYSGSPTLLSATSVPLTQKMVDLCSGLVVNLATDDGTGATCGTFSYAIKQAAQLPAQSQPVTIGFATMAITLTGNLPLISNTNGVNLVFDGGCLAENGRGVPQVRLNNGGVVGGLTLDANVTLRGFAIGGFDGYGVVLNGNANTLLCNRIGTYDGISASPNISGGVRIVGDANGLGQALLPESGNQISGNGGYGIEVVNGTNNELRYNLVGTTFNAQVDLKNSGGAVSIANGVRLKFLPGNRLR